MEKKYICSIPAFNSQREDERKDGWKATCLGFIEGKVLEVKLTPDKFEKTNQQCIQIRINKTWKEIIEEVGGGIENQKPYLVYYGIDKNPWGKKRPPQEGENYRFYLHEWRNQNDNPIQKGWQ